MLDTLASLSGIAALALGVIYATGVLARSGEFAAAGYSPQDIVPLVPFQQFLARGVGLLADPVVIVGVLGVLWPQLITVFTNTVLDPAQKQQQVATVHDRLRLSVFIEALLDHLIDAYSSNQVPRRAVDEIGASLAKSSQLLRGGSERGRTVSRGLLVKAGDAAIELAEKVGDDSRELQTLKQVMPGNRKAARHERWTIVAFGVGTSALLLYWLFFGPLSLAPLMAAVFIVLALLILRARAGMQVTRPWVTSAVVVFVIAYGLGQAYWNPAPLQQAWMLTGDGRVIEGELLTTSGAETGTWYLGQSHATVRAVNVGDMTSVRVVDRPGAKTRYADETLWDRVTR